MAACHQVADDVSTGGAVALVGNPNVGKSVLFQRLTARYTVVANYPGTTLEVTRAGAQFDPDTVVVDTPGIVTFPPRTEDGEVVSRLLLDGRARALVQVGDAKSIRRTLLLTSQLAELDVPMVLALNMADEARERGIHVDRAELAERLGVPVVATVATRGDGVTELVAAIPEARLCASRPRSSRSPSSSAASCTACSSRPEWEPEMAAAGCAEPRLSACAMCGLRFDPAEHVGCASCPLQGGCALACCPACGYSFVDPSTSSVLRLGAQLSSRLRRRARVEDVEAGTLRAVGPGGRARVAGLEGLPLGPREQLEAYGLAPGRSVEVLQTAPVTVVRVEHVEIAFESSLARRIRVEPTDEP